MPEPEKTVQSDADEAPKRVFSAYGVASAVLGLVSVAAIVLGTLIWTGHRDATDERAYQTRVMAAAADWTGVLINMNVDNVDASLQKLHDGTVGQLNSDFEAAITPYREVVRTLKARTTGQIDSVSFELVHHDLDVQPGQRPQPAAALPPELAQRTDNVLVVATSVSENAGDKPATVRWNLRLGVSEVNGKLMISRLESLR
ncbi:hypothetical protein FHT40_000406 [Mycolicibacterium sp. BK556]|uniref:hypothetical protein n=1 Tax=Mycobacteriaceae TaxID=1762 RepID=UPI00105C83C8|nr:MULTISPECIES: hypothetical protein [Mycobacteriaceae]MBB3600773.1 hypothetical protein [Mycolicibacterium sp. BK556]MBB3630527.1 hypothetical protein [Mycolicibacterium sp. BK607]MBB3748518.1 hypothetical protein [Mycolicibacterium sp. BK634]TDO10314.1 hypothetical protein EV580_4602 [Mycobacterium sp. BK086]